MIVGSPLPLAGYGVILADPPWAYDAWSPKGKHRAPEKHYPTMPTPDICALFESLGLEWCCAPHSVLVMWTTFPMLARGDAHQVMKAWGFTPKSGGAWVKLNADGDPFMGLGKIYRGAAECWLLGTRGAPTVRSHSILNAILDERREHSRKPDQMREDLERLYDGPYLEMFGREERPGWDVWGNEPQKFAATA